MSLQNPYLSIVIPVFNEEKNLATLYQRLMTTLNQLIHGSEIIFVNDGSLDQSSQCLENLFNKNPKQIRIIEFMRNYGQHMAIMAGFEQARGEIIITLDADLQNPPEEIPKLLQTIDSGHDVVGTYRENRQDSIFRKWISTLHNKVRAWMIPSLKMKDEGCMLRAYHRSVVTQMCSTGETSTFIPALALQYANNPTEVGVKHEPRFAGRSNYNFYKLIRYNFDLMTNFSLFPLQLFTLIGLMVSFSSFCFMIVILIRRIFLGPEVEGVFTLFGITFFLMGIILLGLGIVGEYIGRIYQEIRKRPRYQIKRILEQTAEPFLKRV